MVYFADAALLLLYALRHVDALFFFFFISSSPMLYADASDAALPAAFDGHFADFAADAAAFRRRHCRRCFAIIILMIKDAMIC